MNIEPAELYQFHCELNDVNPPEILAAVNPKYTDKVKYGSKQFWDFNMTFINYTISGGRLANAIQKGMTWTAPHEHIRRHRPRPEKPDYHTTYRVKENIISVQALAIDSDTEDEKSRFEWWLNQPFIANQAAFLHTTASHTEDKPRCRVVFVLDRPVTVQEAERILKGFMREWGHVDKSCKDAGRVFYGAKDCTVSTIGRVCCVNDALDLADNNRPAVVAPEFDTVPVSVNSKFLQVAFDKLLSNVLNSKDGEKHRTLRDISRTMGGYIASGYYNITDCRNSLRAAVASLPNVANLNTAYSTIDQGLDYGQQSPLHFSQSIRRQ